VRILKAASDVGNLLWALPAMLGLLVARDLADEVRFQRWARKYRRQHAGRRVPTADLRLAYVAQLRPSQAGRAGSRMEAVASTLPRPAHHA